MKNVGQQVRILQFNQKIKRQSKTRFAQASFFFAALQTVCSLLNQSQRTSITNTNKTAFQRSDVTTH